MISLWQATDGERSTYEELEILRELRCGCRCEHWLVLVVISIIGIPIIRSTLEKTQKKRDVHPVLLLPICDIKIPARFERLAEFLGNLRRIAPFELTRRYKPFVREDLGECEALCRVDSEHSSEEGCGRELVSRWRGSRKRKRTQ